MFKAFLMFPKSSPNTDCGSNDLGTQAWEFSANSRKSNFLDEQKGVYEICSGLSFFRGV